MVVLSSAFKGVFKRLQLKESQCALRQQLTFSISQYLCYIFFLSALLKESLKFSVSSTELYHKNQLCLEYLDFFSPKTACFVYVYIATLLATIQMPCGTTLRNAV